MAKSRTRKKSNPKAKLADDVKNDAAEPNVLHTADHLTGVDRHNVYGHPLEDYVCVSRMQQALLDHAGGEITPILSQQFQICVKMARLAVAPGHRDSIVDIAGYARTIEMSIQKAMKLELARREKNQQVK